MRRVLALCAFVAAAAGAALACTLAYSGYDDRFQPASEGGLVPFVTDDAGIQAVAVTKTDLFYASGSAIKRVPLDGGGATVWWSGSSVDDLVSDGNDRIAWLSNSVKFVRRASASDPDAAAATTEQLGLASRFAADDTHVAWTASGTQCCVLADVATWSAPAAQALSMDGGKGATDVAIDDAGVTVFLPGVLGIGRFGFDGSKLCSHGAGVVAPSNWVHTIAAGPSGSPFFFIENTGKGSNGPLHRLASACEDGGATLDPAASAVMTDGANVYWLSSTSLEIAPFDGGSARGVDLGGLGVAMTRDASFVYVVVANQIFRVAKD